MEMQHSEHFAETIPVAGTAYTQTIEVPQNEEWLLQNVGGNNATRAGCWFLAAIRARSGAKNSYFCTEQQAVIAQYCIWNGEKRLLPGCQLLLTIRDGIAGDLIKLTYTAIKRNVK